MDEFDRALNAAVESGRRSRQAIYFTILFEFFCLFAIRQTHFPRWSYARLNAMENYALCFPPDGRRKYEQTSFPGGGRESNNEAINDYCNKLEDVYKYSLPRTDVETMQKIEAENYINQDLHNVNRKDPYTTTILDKQYTYDMHRFRVRQDDLLRESISDLGVPIPFIGTHVDANDIWIFCGPIMTIFMLVLTFTLRSDANNIALASIRAGGDKSKEALVAATCVLGRPSHAALASKNADLTNYRIIAYSVICIPIFNAVWLFYLDFVDHEGSLNTTRPLELTTLPLRGWGTIEICAELISLFLVLRAAQILYRAYVELSEVTRKLQQF